MRPTQRQKLVARIADTYRAVDTYLTLMEAGQSRVAARRAALVRCTRLAQDLEPVFPIDAEVVRDLATTIRQLPPSKQLPITAWAFHRGTVAGAMGALLAVLEDLGAESVEVTAA